MKRKNVGLLVLLLLFGCNKEFETITLADNTVIHEGDMIAAELGNLYSVKVNKLLGHSPENCFFDTFSTKLDAATHRTKYEFQSITCGNLSVTFKGYALSNDSELGLKINSTSREIADADNHFNIVATKDVDVSRMKLVIRKI
ncbi:hypothetical protein I7Z51_002341 [Vibrio parahaemolyticus]|uniref:hypothetical protein n=1 Tax=Vibrio TaxID=662 RepID=UPI001A8FAED0|nr:MULTISPECIES: hypothetical protein [Vibrio]EGQ7973419.1 hypothetical protein [Vibrio parahaemolyticus]MBO0208679.1 hypothetical protein [Vibrio sp. Vb0877]MCR9809779.1 hypothetical protein [Vibrio parahaemolyticus]